MICGESEFHVEHSRPHGCSASAASSTTHVNGVPTAYWSRLPAWPSRGTSRVRASLLCSRIARRKAHVSRATSHEARQRQTLKRESPFWSDDSWQRCFTGNIGWVVLRNGSDPITARASRNQERLRRVSRETLPVPAVPPSDLSRRFSSTRPRVHSTHGRRSCPPRLLRHQTSRLGSLVRLICRPRLRCFTWNVGWFAGGLCLPRNLCSSETTTRVGSRHPREHHWPAHEKRWVLQAGSIVSAPSLGRLVSRGTSSVGPTSDGITHSRRDIGRERCTRRFHGKHPRTCSQATRRGCCGSDHGSQARESGWGDVSRRTGRRAVHSADMGTAGGDESRCFP